MCKWEKQLDRWVNYVGRKEKLVIYESSIKWRKVTDEPWLSECVENFRNSESFASHSKELIKQADKNSYMDRRNSLVRRG